jgi:hypothetical protein
MIDSQQPPELQSEEALPPEPEVTAEDTARDAGLRGNLPGLLRVRRWTEPPAVSG